MHSINLDLTLRGHRLQQEPGGSRERPWVKATEVQDEGKVKDCCRAHNN